MKAALLSLICLAASLSLAQAGGSLQDLKNTFTGLKNNPFHQYDLDGVQGHFKQIPFTDLYTYYVAVMVIGNDNNKNRIKNKDDFKNFMSSGPECVEYLKSFRVRDYKLASLEEFVKLDSCLGYLYEKSDRHAEDKTNNAALARDLENYVDDAKLKEIYQGTSIDHWDEQVKDCVGDLFLGAFQLRHQFGSVDCNNHWILLLLRFASCQRGNDVNNPLVSEGLRQNDSYLSRIYDLVRQRGQQCYNQELAYINKASRSEYATRYFYRGKNTIGKLFNPLESSHYERMLSEPIVKLLKVVQGVEKNINVRRLNQLLVSFQRKDSPGFIESLKLNLAKYADKQYFKRSSLKSNRKTDPTGTTLYREYIDNLCSFFRVSTRESNYDFATPLAHMVTILDFHSVFGIERQTFVQEVLAKGRDTAPIYTSVALCNILSFTEGALELDQATTKEHFVVDFQPHYENELPKWPTLSFY